MVFRANSTIVIGCNLCSCASSVSIIIPVSAVLVKSHMGVSHLRLCSQYLLLCANVTSKFEHSGKIESFLD